MFGRIYSWLMSFYPSPDYEPFIGPQYLHVFYTKATYAIREGVDPCQLLHTLGRKIEDRSGIDMEELEKYLDLPQIVELENAAAQITAPALQVGNENLKTQLHQANEIGRLLTALTFRNSLSVVGSLYYHVEQGRRLVLRPLNGSGYGVPFIVSDSPTFPTAGWPELY
jgi:hypothetical protein